MSSIAKTNSLRILDAAAVAYQPVEYPVSDNLIDAVSVAKKINLPQEQCFKTLVTVNPSKEYFMFVIPAGTELDLKKAAKVSGSKSIVMIPQKELFPLTGFIHGGCSPIGMKKQFPVFIDETAQLFDTIGVSGGRVGLSVILAPESLSCVTGAVFADLTR